jgi:hypothetical protein
VEWLLGDTQYVGPAVVAALARAVALASAAGAVASSAASPIMPASRAYADCRACLGDDPRNPGGPALGRFPMYLDNCLLRRDMTFLREDQENFLHKKDVSETPEVYLHTRSRR